MKALSIRQPWAWAILHGAKRVENRDWSSCRYRGPILLHASKGCTRDEYELAQMSIVEMRADMRARGELGPDLIKVPTLKEQPRGVLLGIARIVGATRHPEYIVSMESGTRPILGLTPAQVLAELDAPLAAEVAA